MLRKRQLEGGDCLPCTLNKPHYKEPQKEEEGRRKVRRSCSVWRGGNGTGEIVGCTGLLRNQGRRHLEKVVGR